MDVTGKVIVVTGAASGIGRALSERFAREGAEALVLGDRSAAALDEVARAVGGTAVTTDVAVESDVARLVGTALAAHGRVDLFCSNAGIFVGGGAEVSDGEWRRIFDVNVMAHVYASRAVLPSMLARGEGYFLATVSAAGLLSQIGSAPYSVTKHAALAFAEWLSIEHGDRGIKVSCLCPQGVRTAMLDQGGGPAFLRDGSLDAGAVADAAVTGLREEKFLILPHPEVATYFERKASDYDRWLAGMRRLAKKVRESL